MTEVAIAVGVLTGVFSLFFCMLTGLRYLLDDEVQEYEANPVWLLSESVEYSYA